MSARIVRDEPAWEYPGGSCHLRVWQYEDGTLVAVLHEPATGGGVSVANAVEGVLGQLEEEYAETYGSRPLVVHHTTAGWLGGPEWHDVLEVSGEIRWEPCTPEDVAEEFGVTVDEMIPEWAGA